MRRIAASMSCTCLMILTLGAAAPSLSAADERPVGTLERIYRVQHMGVQDATLLAQQLCLDQPQTAGCIFDIKGGTWFSYVTDAATHTKIAALLASHDLPPPSLQFRLTLILASDASQSMPTLRPGELRALEELRGFLPYKGFQLLDAGAIRSTGREAHLRLGRDVVYDVGLRFRRQNPGASTIVVDEFGLRQRDDLILSSSFALEPGETVVVGTSRLEDGDGKALIVLLTAEK